MNTVRSRIHENEYYKISVFIFIIHEYSCIHEALWKYHAAVCHTLYVTRSMPHTDTYNTAVEARNTWTRHTILALSYPTVGWLDCRRGTRPVDETHGRDACETHRYIRHGRRGTRHMEETHDPRSGCFCPILGSNGSTAVEARGPWTRRTPSASCCPASCCPACTRRPASIARRERRDRREQRGHRYQHGRRWHRRERRGRR